MRRLVGWLAFLLVVAIALLFAREYVRRHPQDVPWTRLDLRQPIGAFTGRKLAALDDEPRQCRALLLGAGARDLALPPRRHGPDCGYDDGMRLAADGRAMRYLPAGIVTSCPVAAGLWLFEQRVVQHAAIRHFGVPATAIDHAGSYSCRRLYGREIGEFSEHAGANAIDIIGFRLADGRRITVERGWPAAGPEAAFLREVRDGACRLFATVLSPDYNAAHRDHLHLDQASRGRLGWRLCR